MEFPFIEDLLYDNIFANNILFNGHSNPFYRQKMCYKMYYTVRFTDKGTKAQRI